METITINIADYYGNPSYYSVMPQDIFDALELASLRGEPTTAVDKALYEKMFIDYKEKMAEWQSK